ncbi:plasmid pRiA4b ORF-3 family protein [bacterium]|nr:plasmid pRiA4b ORF-3 family protein [bacterium]
MKKKFENVYQFKVSLIDITPQIWRRIQVPETYTFFDLHVAVQDAMGWQDYHYYEFEILNPSTQQKDIIGIPDDEMREVIPSWKKKLSDGFTLENNIALYVYDFGDSWEHKVKLEKALPRVEGTKYPICIQGKRACPPEDVGGIWGYEDFLKIISDPKHDEYEDMMEWIGGEFDPEYFQPESVIFMDPVKRRKNFMP